MVAKTFSQMDDSKVLLAGLPMKNLVRIPSSSDVLFCRIFGGESHRTFSMPKRDFVGRSSDTLIQVVRGRPYQVMVVRPTCVVGGSLSTNRDKASRDVRAKTGSFM